MKWTRGHVIGQGSSATVSVATSPNSGNVFAVKSAEVSRSESLQREAEILSSLRNPHVVSYLGNDITREKNDIVHYNLFLDYVPAGTLSDAVARRKGLDESTIRRYVLGIVGGLDYLHGLGIAHCDIKGRNILLAEDGPKIADFGCARFTAAEEDRGRGRGGVIAGSPMFMAPEVSRQESQGTACDVWSLGCTFIEMTGRLPWADAGEHPAGLLYKIACSDEIPEIPEFLSPAARDFLRRCLVRNPAERWTAAELLNHPFLKAAATATEKNLETPTSVLDHRRNWSSVEEENEVATESELGCLASNADERIQRLAVSPGEVASIYLDGQDWITIRSSSDGY